MILGTLHALYLRLGDCIQPQLHKPNIFDQAPEEHHSKTIVVMGDYLTTQEQTDAYKRGARSALSSIPNFVGASLLYVNKHTKDLYVHNLAFAADLARLHKYSILNIERHNEARKNNPVSDQQYIAQCRTLHPGILTFEKWARTRGAKSERTEKWNNVTIQNLVTGKH